CRGYSDSLFTF
nr:immunoglobulin light chain junction region [Macaca mulatta]